MRLNTPRSDYALNRRAVGFFHALPAWQAVEREESQNERGREKIPPASDLLALHALVLPLSLPFGRLPRRPRRLSHAGSLLFGRLPRRLSHAGPTKDKRRRNQLCVRMINYTSLRLASCGCIWLLCVFLGIYRACCWMM